MEQDARQWRGDRVAAGKKISEALRNSEALKEQSRKVIEEYCAKFDEYLSTSLPHVERVGEYRGALETTSLWCKKHDVRFDKKPRDIKGGGKGCPACVSEARSTNNANKRPETIQKAKETCERKYGCSSGKAFAQRAAQSRILRSISHLDNERKRQYFSKEWMEGFNSNHNINEIAQHFEVKRDVILGQLQRLGLTPFVQKSSLGEREILSFIQGRGFDVIGNDRSVIAPKEIDIYIPQTSIAIEYHGVYWHSLADKTYHSEKLEAATRAGIRLIQIWEDDYIGRPEVVRRFLLNLLHKNESKINARECDVIEIDQPSYAGFLDAWHMQGSHQTASSRLGLVMNSKLVAVMGFRPKPSNVRKYGEGEGYELVRFASVGVRGGFSKLLKAFERSRNVDYIYSFADLEIVHPTENVYTSNGFEEFDRIDPDYSYAGTITGGTREHKFKWRKSRFAALGYDVEGKTESELAEEAGLRRCWDSGKVCFIRR